MKYWAASLALHGAAAGLLALAWLKPAAPTTAEPLRWEVVFAPAPVAAPSPPATPPTERPAAPPPRPEPAKTEPPPEPVRPAEPPPTPPPAAEPVARPPDPVPRPPEPVTRPAEPVAPAALVASVPARPPASPPAAPPDPPRPVAAAPTLAAARPTIPEPPANAAAEVERRWYLALLEQLRAMKRYPMAARRLGQEGVVLIEARIGPDGQLQGVTVKRGSGYPLLDRDALRLIEAAAAQARSQLQPERPTRLEIPIAYRLES